MKVHYATGPYWGNERTACGREFTERFQGGTQTHALKTTLVMAEVTCKRCIIVEQITYGRVDEESNG